MCWERLRRVLAALLGLSELVEILLWPAITWRQWLPRYWVSWPRDAEMRDGMAVASMLAAGAAIAILRIVAELPPSCRRYILFMLAGLGSVATLWAWAEYETYFAELQAGLGPIGTLNWACGKVALAWRYALMSGLATLALTALLWLLRAWLSSQASVARRERNTGLTSGFA